MQTKRTSLLVSIASKACETRCNRQLLSGSVQSGQSVPDLDSALEVAEAEA